MTTNQNKSATINHEDAMVLMDVVDTLRHAQSEQEELMNTFKSDEEIVDFVRRMYASQGMEVSDETIQNGMMMMKEKRFEFKQPDLGAFKIIADAHINRDKVMKVAINTAGGVAIAAGLAGGGTMAVGAYQDSAHQKVVAANTAYEQTIASFIERALREANEASNLSSNELKGYSEKVVLVAQNLEAEYNSILSSFDKDAEDERKASTQYNQKLSQFNNKLGNDSKFVTHFLYFVKSKNNFSDTVASSATPSYLNSAKNHFVLEVDNTDRKSVV